MYGFSVQTDAGALSLGFLLTALQIVCDLARNALQPTSGSQHTVWEPLLLTSIHMKILSIKNEVVHK